MTYKELVMELVDLVLELNSKRINVDITGRCTEIWLFNEEPTVIGNIDIQQLNDNCYEFSLMYYDKDLNCKHIDIDTAREYIKNNAI